MNDTDALVEGVPQADAYSRVVARANANLTRLFARVQFRRIVPPGNRWRWFLASRWRRVLVVAALFTLYLIVIRLLRLSLQP
jgi:hypothetical protein